MYVTCTYNMQQRSFLAHNID